MWVADMDFESPACIKSALRKYVDNGIFGYHSEPKELRDILKKYLKNKGWNIKKEWIVLTPSVGAPIYSIYNLIPKNTQVIIPTPIYLNLPAKVKKLGVITSVVMSIFDESKGTVDLGNTTPELQAYSDSESMHPKMDKILNRSERSGAQLSMSTYKDYDILVMNNIAQIVDRGIVGSVQWDVITEALPGTFRTGISQIQLKRKLLEGESVGISVNASVAINELDRTKLILTYDADTIPTNTDLPSPSGRNNTGSVDYIVDPLKFNLSYFCEKKYSTEKTEKDRR